MKFCVTVPLVGYSCVSVEAKNEEEAKEKAIDQCCDFDNDDVDIMELCGIEKVVEGNVVNHPFWTIEVEKQEENNE